MPDAVEEFCGGSNNLSLTSRKISKLKAISIKLSLLTLSYLCQTLVIFFNSPVEVFR